MDYWQILRSALGKRQVILPCAVGGVLRGGKILLVRDTAGKWSLPGGLQELDESISDTIVRELREELGVAFEPDCLVGVHTEPRFVGEFPNGDRIQPVLFLFRMKDAPGCEFRLQEAELTDARFFDLGSLPEISPHCREEIEDLLGFNGTVVVK